MFSNWHSTLPPHISALQKYWLHRPGALTKGLRQLGVVQLRVTREFESRLSQDEAPLLQLPVNSPTWVREIVMAIDSIDSVVARSFTPLAASDTIWAGMRSLQTRPLADMLYHNPHIRRSPFYTSQLHETQPFYESIYHALGPACPRAKKLLVRSSVFWMQEQPLLVAECFLPDFWQLAHNKGQL